MMCVHKSFKCRKKYYKVIFQPEHGEDIRSVYYTWICFWLICKRNFKKDMTPTYLVCVCKSSCSIDKRLCIVAFLLIKLKTNKKQNKTKKTPASCIAVCESTSGNIHWFFSFALSFNIIQTNHDAFLAISFTQTKPWLSMWNNYRVRSVSQ